MKPKRNLSGIYLRFHNPETGTSENRCFEDLSHQEQLNLLARKESSWVLSLAIQLADALNQIGEEFNIEK